MAKDIDPRLLALYGHWCAADSVKYMVDASRTDRKKSVRGTALPSDLAQAGEAYSMFLRLSVWYALEYVFIEGYREFGDSDALIDSLLEDDFVQTLRRFRNAHLPLPRRSVKRQAAGLSRNARHRKLDSKGAPGFRTLLSRPHAYRRDPCRPSHQGTVVRLLDESAPPNPALQTDVVLAGARNHAAERQGR